MRGNIYLSPFLKLQSFYHIAREKLNCLDRSPHRILKRQHQVVFFFSKFLYLPYFHVLKQKNWSRIPPAKRRERPHDRIYFFRNIVKGKRCVSFAPLFYFFAFFRFPKRKCEPLFKYMNASSRYREPTGTCMSPVILPYPLRFSHKLHNVHGTI